MSCTFIKSNTCFTAIQKSSHFNILKRIASTRTPDTVLITKNLEEPVIVINTQDEVDIIGPPDVVSNLRHVVRKRLISETALQQKLRQMQDITQEWNQDFWSKHNTRFVTEKHIYVNSKQTEVGEKRTLTADEMSEFYKRFLDENWKTHLEYNAEWYKRNFTLLILALRVNLEKGLLKFHS